MLTIRKWHRCSCGKPTPTEGLATCRVCGRYEFKEWNGKRSLFNPDGTDETSIHSIRRVINEQLSGTADCRSENRVLSQLGGGKDQRKTRSSSDREISYGWSRHERHGSPYGRVSAT